MVVSIKQFEVISKTKFNGEKMRVLLIIFLSFFAFSDDHDSMYQELNAVYLYCSVEEGLSDSKAVRSGEIVSQVTPSSFVT